MANPMLQGMGYGKVLITISATYSVLEDHEYLWALPMISKVSKTMLTLRYDALIGESSNGVIFDK